MEVNSVSELNDVERLTKQLRLLNDIQADNLQGCWEKEQDAGRYLWSDSMFVLHGLPVSPDNTISIRDANALIHRDDLAHMLQKRMELERTGFVEYYVRIITAEGNFKRIHAREKKIDQDGVIVFRGNWQDERREREFQLSLRDQINQHALQLKIFEQAEEVAQLGSWRINLETFETVYSDNVYRIYGLEPQSIPPHVDSFRKFIHPEDRAVVIRTQEKSYVEMIPLHLEYRIIREDGETRYISQVSHMLKNEKGEHILSGSTRDVTEQKLLEIQLREANDILSLHNELFIQAEQIGQLGTWQVNLDTRKTMYSANLYRIYGLKPQAISPGLENFIHYIHPDDRDLIRDVHHKAFNDRIAPDVEFRITRADGKARTLRQKSRFIKNADGEQLMIGIVQDITHQQQKDWLLKETNEKLAVQNEAFRQAEKVARIGSWTWHLSSDEIVVSENVYVIYGLKPQSIPASTTNFNKFVHPDDRERIIELQERIRKENEPLSSEFRIIRPDGEMRYLRSRSQPITSPEGHALVIGMIQDVTEEVMLQQRLLDRMRFAEVLSDSMPDRIIMTDVANNIISWNERCEDLYGKKKEDVLGRNFFDILPQARVPAVLERFKRALAGETIHLPVMATLQIPGFQELLMVPFKDEQGRVRGVLHVLHDITAQQELQAQLANRLHFIEKLLESSIDRIMVLDKDLYFQLWNTQCEKYYGYHRKEVMGRNVLEIFPKFKLDPLYRHCLQALEGETVHVPANEKAGLAGYQESYFVPLKNDKKEVTGVLWVMHDLTERFIAEEQLRESRLFIKQINDATPDLIYVMDVPEQKIVFINDRVLELVGQDAEHIYRQGAEIFKEMVHPDDYEKRQQHAISLQNIADGEIKEVEVRLKGADGSWRWFKLRDRVFKRNEEGAVWQTIGLAEDITDRKLAQEQILRQQELLRQAEEIAHIGSWELDLSSDKLTWSDEIFRIYGYAAQSFEPVHEFYLETIHPEDRKLLKLAIRKAIAEKRHYSLTCRIFTLDGQLRYVQTRGRAVADPDSGQVVRIIGTMQDITEQKMLEEELRKKNELMRLRHQTDRQTEKLKNVGSWQWNVETGKVIWGESMFVLFGQRPYAFDPSVEKFLELIHPGDRERIRKEIDNMVTLREGILPDLEFRLLVNGNTRYLRSSGRLIISDNGRYVIGSVMDITADALLRQQLSEKIRLLEDANEELMSFAFVASHDLREPLRKIQIFSDWLCKKESERLSPEGLDRFNRIQAAVHRMDVLIDDILSFSHINTGPKKFVKFELNQVLENVKSDLAETIADTHAVIESDNLPAMNGNSSLLAQLFQNMISNGIKYQQPGNIPHIRIKCTQVHGKQIEHFAAVPDANYLMLSFSDNGIGFEEQYTRKIFQMFQRLHGISEYPGTGMGLAICKKIAEHHNGFIVARSKPGYGSVFECYFRLG